MRIFAGLTVVGIVTLWSGVALAQTDVSPPPFIGPYLFFNADSEGVDVIASGVRTRSGDMVTITVASIASPHRQIIFPRADQEFQVDCRGRRLRMVRLAYYDEVGVFLVAGNEIQPWSSAEENGWLRSLTAFACEGVTPAGATSYRNLYAGVEAYYVTLDGGR